MVITSFPIFVFLMPVPVPAIVGVGGECGLLQLQNNRLTSMRTG